MNGTANENCSVPRDRVGLFDRAAVYSAGFGLNCDIQLPVSAWPAAICDGRSNPGFDFGRFVGRSPKMLQMYARIRRAAPVDSTVLILGESGTGKELAAMALHRYSPRKTDRAERDARPGCLA